MSYDGEGKLATIKGPANLNGERYSLTYAYDTTVDIYVESVTDNFSASQGGPCRPRPTISGSARSPRPPTRTARSSPTATTSSAASPRYGHQNPATFIDRDSRFVAPQTVAGAALCTVGFWVCVGGAVVVVVGAVGGAVWYFSSSGSETNSGTNTSTGTSTLSLPGGGRTNPAGTDDNDNGRYVYRRSGFEKQSKSWIVCYEPRGRRRVPYATRASWIEQKL